MNQRFQQLALEAWRLTAEETADRNGTIPQDEVTDIFEVKFAQLIYQDIITVVAAQALSNHSALDVFKNLKRIYEGWEYPDT